MNPVPKHACTQCYGAREVTDPAREFTFMGRWFAGSAKQVACPSCSVVIARGVRTHRTTKQQSIVPVTFECRYRANKLVLSITDGGVTGYESVYLDDYFYDTTRLKGWRACAGTTGSYDTLHVPAKEMRALYERLRLT